MIAYLHTSEFSTMIGLDHVPRKHEWLRLPAGNEQDERDGMYEILLVMHTVPDGRVDVYASRVADATTNVNWRNVMGPR